MIELMLKDLKSIIIANILAALTTHACLKTYDPVPLWVGVVGLLIIPSIATYFISANTSLFVSGLLFAYPIFCIALPVSVCAYRLSPFHPLAKYPGPTILKVTKLWAAWIAYRGKTHIYIKKLHDHYGPIVRTGPNELSTTEKGLIPQILGNLGMPKGPLWDGRRFGNAEGSKGYDTIIDLRDSVLHAELRVPWNKAFGAGPMKNYEGLLIRRIIELNDRLKNLCSKGRARVDIAKWFSCFSYDFMGDLLLAGDFRLMEDGDKEGRLEMMDNAMYFIGITQHLPWIAKLVSSLPIINKGLKGFVNYAIENAIKRSRIDMKRKDLFHYLCEASGSSESDFSLIVGDVLLAMIAGSDTTSSVLSSAIYLLLSHPDKLENLQQEVDKTFTEHEINMNTQLFADDGTVVKMYGEVLGSMKYLNAVINETLRLFPAVPTSLQRAPAKGSSSKILKLGNTSILLPEGNAISVPPYVLQRDPRYFFPHPDTFIPERWLASSTGTEYVTSRDAFIPFSAGPQNCVGRPLALMEMRYALAVLARNYNMVFNAPKYAPILWEQGLEDRFTFTKSRLDIGITLRENK